MSNLQSSGRGGAGNIRDSSKNVPLQPEDLQTPTLKTAVVTTGRGGTGNMAKNTDPVETRLRQDVEPVVRRSSNATHVGRGGSGNIFTNADDAEKARNELSKTSSSAVEDSAVATTAGAGDKKDPGWAEKAKNLLSGKK